MSISSEVSDSEHDSDREIQEAFKAGIIKPGLNIEVHEDPGRKRTNNVVGLQRCLNSIKQNMDWIERLDVTTGLAPTAPEIALRLAEMEEDARTGKIKVKKSLDPTVDDFRREMNFHRQAQAAVLFAIPSLHKLGVQTKRPDDYFAQMAKSDAHMQKVRNSLLKTKVGLERSEKVKMIRQNQKLMKQRQTVALLGRQKEKRELNEQVKKYRKGLRNDLDFLEPDQRKKKKGANPNVFNGSKGNKSVNKRRLVKNDKYGGGGKKRGMKTNSTSSHADFDRKSKKLGGKAQKGGSSQTKRNSMNKNKPNRRRSSRK